MPRAFSETEREAVRQRLKTAARASLAERGFRRTSVAELAREGGISKGAFYGFFDSKEELVFEVLEEAEAEVRTELERRMVEAEPRERVRRFVAFLFEILERHPVLRLLSDPDETAVLFRSMPPEELAARMSDDDRYFGDMFRRWREEGWLADVSPGVLAGLPRLALAVAQQRELIGDERYRPLTELVAEALADRLTREA
jgi:AcrR family transcriptional regulator